jgi:tetratricopeptide (TPR) repeat protein
MDGLTILREQQKDFVERLQFHDLLHCHKAGRHGEIVTIAGDILEKIKNLSQQLIVRYELDRSRWDYSFIFQQILSQKLAEKAISYLLVNSIDSIGFRKEYTQKLVSNIPLAIDATSSLKVKVINTEISKLKYSIEPKEVRKHRVFIFAVIPQKIDIFSRSVEVIVCGFLPSEYLKIAGNKIAISLPDLFYSGGLSSYLNNIDKSLIDPFESAQNCLAIQDYLGTIDNLEVAVREGNKQDIAYKIMGYARYLMGDKEMAINNYNRAIELNPNYAEAYLNRAESYYQLGNYDRAIIDYTEVIRINSYNGSFYIWRGEALTRLGDYDRAILDYNEAIRINPHDYICYVWRGDLRSRMEDYKGAIEDYSLAIDFASSNHDDSLSIYVLDSVYFNRGNARYQLGEYQRAIEDYSQAIQINPNYAEAYLKRAIVYYKTGDYQSGINDSDRATEIDPACML